MKQIVEKIIEIKSKDNDDFLAEFPDKKPIFDYRKASDEEIAEFEKEFNIKLPELIGDYFKQFNPIKANLMFVELLGLDAIKKNHKTLAGYTEALRLGLLPIADDNGDLICVNTKKEKGRLLTYSHEEDDFQEGIETFDMFPANLLKRKEEHEQGE